MCEGQILPWTTSFQIDRMLKVSLKYGVLVSKNGQLGFISNLLLSHPGM